MDLSVSKKIFFQSLSHFQSVVEKRNTIPILSNLKLKAYNGSLEVTATDLALEISEKILANIKTEGELTIPSQLLFDIVRKAPEDSRIELREESESGQVFIFFGDSKFSLPYLPTSDFPEMEEENLNQSISLDSKKLSYLLNDTKFSMGVDESRQYLNGIYFHHIENKLIAVATDGHRLSKCQVICEQNFTDFEGIIIPKKTVFEITKILENVSESIKLSFSKTKIKLDLKNLILTSKLLNANFPDYESVIPKKNDGKLHYDFIIASQPYRSRISAEKKVKYVIDPMIKSLDKNGKLVVVHACGGDPGNQIVKKIWPKEKPFPSLHDSIVKYIKNNTDKEFLRDLKFHKKQKIKYILRALPNEISGGIATSLIFSAWNAAVYVNQISDEQIMRAERQKNYQKIVQQIVNKYQGIYFNNELFVIEKK